MTTFHRQVQGVATSALKNVHLSGLHTLVVSKLFICEPQEHLLCENTGSNSHCGTAVPKGSDDAVHVHHLVFLGFSTSSYSSVKREEKKNSVSETGSISFLS
jgi:hypothetical protein